MTPFDGIRTAVEETGLALTGWLHPDAEDGAPEGVRTILLLGYGDGALWDAFRASAEANDGRLHGLDRWSERVIGGLAAELGAAALYPFGGPPYQPFIRWIYKGEPVHQSKLGMSIHQDRGLWSGWRGALALSERIEIPAIHRGDHPCTPCAAPCRDACPVNAFSDDGYDTTACRAHLNAPKGELCRSLGCLARRACPVGTAFTHSAAQAAFHLNAFRIA